jgi:ECF transporter S component (folate family)
MKIKKPVITVKMLVLMSLFIALSIVLTRFASIMLAGGTIRLGFGSLPIIFSGLLLGPFAGGIVGLVADLLGVAVINQGVFHIGFTLSSMLTGIIPGLVVMAFRNRKIAAIVVSNVLVYIIVSLVLNTIWVSQLFGKAFVVLLPSRAISQGIVTVISIFLISILMKVTEKLKYN